MEYHVEKNEQPMTAQREVAIMEAEIVKRGVSRHLLVTIAELSELQKALCRYLDFEERLDRHSPAVGIAVTRIREEMADVSIKLSQLELIFGDVTDREIWELERLARNFGEA